MAEVLYDELGRAIFTEEMRKEYTILVPQMAPHHFGLVTSALKSEGYNVELLQTTHQTLINEGLKYVHNDTCVPALFVIGQLVDAVKSGKYDHNKIALIITQTGGGCRASNYIHLLRKALKKAGYPHVPVISFNISGLESQPGFKITGALTFKLLNSIIAGDIIMQLVNECRPYEVNKGDTLKMAEKWQDEISALFKTKKGHKWKNMKNIIANMIGDFASIKRVKRNIPKVGVVGEIYVKFSPLGNNNLEEYLVEQGCEIVIPGMLDFFLFKLDYRALEVDLYGGKGLKKLAVRFFMNVMEGRRDFIRKHLKKHDFHVPEKFANLKKYVDGYVSHGNRMGEGWLLTAEMIELIHMGAPNIVCTQPFGCLPNHISGKGMFKKIKDNFPEANIVPIDYDTSASEINQINRIKLMVTNAYRNLEANK